MKKTTAAMALCLLSGTANAALIDFTGGTVVQNNGDTYVTDGTTNYSNVSYYVEDGFKLEFLFNSAPTSFATHVGDYYGTGNDVFHAHWADNGSGNQLNTYGEVYEIRVSRLDGATFDLGGFRVSTNTAHGGGHSDGSELTWVNSSKGSNLFNVTPDNWGLGSGPDPLITIDPSNTYFDDITWFSFTNDALSSAVGLGLDNFFLDEPGDPNGVDPTDPQPVPAPMPLALMALGLLGLGYTRAKKAA